MTHRQQVHTAHEHSREINLQVLKPGTKVEYHPPGTTKQRTVGIIKSVLIPDDVAPPKETDAEKDYRIHAAGTGEMPELEPTVVIENNHTRKESVCGLQDIYRVV
ncbi:hypothetical protein HK102_013536 [Quaeritorhiza haematococci]|nr:hypothetical protein HK102_013536 [Quaeritorhiza haematococci]